MFNIGAGEMTLIAVVALLLLGPKRLPELARGIGKFMREFRRQTDEVRGVVEREFYRMDDEVSIKEPPLALTPADGAVTHGDVPPVDTLPAVTEDTRSQALMPSTSGSAEAPTAPAAPEPVAVTPPKTET